MRRAQTETLDQFTRSCDHRSNAAACNSETCCGVPCFTLHIKDFGSCWAAASVQTVLVFTHCLVCHFSHIVTTTYTTYCCVI